MPVTPLEIQLVSTAVVYLIQTGKLIATEVKDFVHAVFGAQPGRTEAELDAISADVQSRAEVREALSKAEAGL